MKEKIVRALRVIGALAVVRQSAILVFALAVLVGAAAIASEMFEDISAAFGYSALVVILWASGTALAFQIIDLLTPMLSFKEIAERNPWVIVALIGIAGGCIAYLLKSVKLAGLL